MAAPKGIKKRVKTKTETYITILLRIEFDIDIFDRLHSTYKKYFKMLQSTSSGIGNLKEDKEKIEDLEDIIVHEYIPLEDPMKETSVMYKHKWGM